METKNLLNKKITQWLLLVAMLVGCSANALATVTDIRLTGDFTANSVSPNWSNTTTLKLSNNQGVVYYNDFNVTTGGNAKAVQYNNWDWSYGSGSDDYGLSTGNYTIAANGNCSNGGCTLAVVATSKKFVGKTYYIDLRNFTEYKNNCVLKTYVYIDANCSDTYFLEQASISETSTTNVYKATFTTDAPVYSIKLARNVSGTDYNLIQLKDWSSSYNCIKVTGYDSGEKSYFSDCVDPNVNSQTTAAASYCKNASSVTQLSVSASGTNATYKWQQSTTGTSDWSDVSTGTGYTTATFKPSVTTSGTLYYKCIVSACNKTAASQVSGAIKVYGDPTATTSATVSNITNTTATVSGSSCATGTPASTITGYGIEINSTKYPKTSGTTSSFDVALTGLSANTTYTYKAYVTDGCTTKYGDEKSFTTAPGSIYVRGPIMGDNGDGGSSECWNNASYYEMQNNGSNVFTKTFNPSGNYCDYGPKEFVLTMENNDNHKLNPDWFGSKTGCQKSSRQGEGNNFESTLKYSNADQLTLTVTWNEDEDYSISLVKTNNQPTDLYIKGPLVDGNWDGGYKQPGYTKNGDTYVFTFEAKTGGDAREFCISSTQGDKGKIHYTTTKGTYAGWDFKDTQEGKNFVASDQIVTRDNFPIKVTVTYVGDADYDFTLDIESNGCEKPTLSLTMPYSSGKTYNKITANAQITNTGTCTINEFGVEAFSNADCTQRVSYTTGSTSSTSEQSLEVTGLTANTKYWFRAYAKTDDGDTYSSVVTDFTRVNAEKMSATNITSSSATLQGKALVDGGFATELKSNALFKYGTTNVVADATSVTSSSKAIGSVITFNLSGLAAGTTYYYWFCPTTTDGEHPTTPNYPMNSFTTNRVHSDIVLDNQSVCVGANITLEPTCDTAINGFTYESKNTGVATVDANGVVHGVAAGAATITVTTKEVSGYDVATKDITVTVNAGPVITVTPASPKAYEVITLSTDENVIWAKTAGSAGAYFVGADGTAISGDPAAATESIKFKAPADSYTITATPAGADCAGSANITVSADSETCN